MTDRDTFAAAALTGLLDKTDAGKDLAAWWPEMVCQAAYRWADAMLRERERRVPETLPKEKRAEVSVTLTDAEREAVETATLEADAHQHTQRAATLRGLLERLA